MMLLHAMLVLAQSGGGGDRTLMIVFAFGILLMSVVLHEVAHGYVAFKLGDPTAYMAGRLTLNPIKHIDLMWTIVIPILLYFFAGIWFGGAKPVPINPYYFRDSSKGMMLTAIAGPATNISLALCGILFFAASVKIQPAAASVHYLMFLAVQINVLLAIFNLIPVPPLDGSRVLRHFMPYNIKEKFDAIEPYGIFILIILIYTGITRIIIMPTFTLLERLRIFLHTVL